MSGKSWGSDSNGYPHIFDHARLRNSTADIADIGDIRNTNCRPWNRKWKPEVEIALERKVLAMRFQRLPPHFRLCPTQKRHCRHGPTSADIGNRKCRLRNRMLKPEVEITFEWKELEMRFQRLPHIFDYARHRNVTAETVRHRPTSETGSVGHETGNGNRKWK